MLNQGNMAEIEEAEIHRFIFNLCKVRIVVLNITFINISVISWWSVLLVEKTRVHGENLWPATSHWQTLSHRVVSYIHLPMSWIWTHNAIVVMGRALIAQVVINATTMISWQQWPLNLCTVHTCLHANFKL